MYYVQSICIAEICTMSSESWVCVYVCTSLRDINSLSQYFNACCTYCRRWFTISLLWPSFATNSSLIHLHILFKQFYNMLQGVCQQIENINKIILNRKSWVSKTIHILEKYNYLPLAATGCKSIVHNIPI